MSEDKIATNDTKVPTAPDELLNLDEAVQFLGTSRPTLYRLLGQSELKGMKVGRQWRFRRADLIAYLERSPVAVTAAATEALDTELAFFAAELDRSGATPLEESADATDAERRTERLARQIIALALAASSSDIHLEPVRQGSDSYLLLRHRIDGLLHEIRRMPAGLHEPLTLQLKQMAAMDLNERRLPQDGRLRVPSGGNEFEVRVSSLPTLFGESIVMRILARSAELPQLDQLGLSEPALDRVRALAREPNGIVVAAGPVGSGRSTLLYSFLQEIADKGRKIFAVEELIEYVPPYTTPVQINRKAGLTLSGALRAVMRQDPDIILVGEIPDLQIAQMAASMALTGHMVLTTVTARGAAEALRRLLDMGAEPVNLIRSLLAIVTTRLVRRICLECKEAYPIPDSAPVFEHLRRLAAEGGYDVPVDAQLHRGRGCDQCRNSGYRGRTGLYEVMTTSESLEEAMLRGAPAQELTDIAVEGGMRTWIAEGARKVVEGETTYDEVLRALAVPF